MKDEFYKRLLDNLADGVYFVDRDRRITYWNRAAEIMTGYSSSEVVGTLCFDNHLQHIDHDGHDLCKGDCPLAKTISDGVPRQEDLFLHHKDGHRIPISVKISPIYDEGHRVAGAVEIFSDISSKVSALEEVEKLQKEALLDPLTGLANRRYTELHLRSKLDEMLRFDWEVGVLFIDIDGFKKINDTRGHEVGDMALKVVSRTLLSNTRSYDFVGRWGGDEFVAVLTRISAGQLYFIANRFRFLVEKSSLFAGGEPVTLTVSIGASMGRKGDTPDSLVDRADKLMYRSKTQGRNRVTADA